jgi:hypothetical protein
MKRIWRENGLSIVALATFALILVGQSIAGYFESQQDSDEHGLPPESYVEYLASGHFFEATFENFESEFLQMGAFVWLTTFLRQKGSPESKKLQGHEAVDEDPRRSKRPDSPWPVKRGGWILTLYENSLSLTFLALFVISFAIHAISGAAEYSEEQVAHGGEAISAIDYVATSRFWFESLQNWQSEFMAVGALVVLAVFLRQRGSPESKPVAHPHAETGRE